MCLSMIASEKNDKTKKPDVLTFSRCHVFSFSRSFGRLADADLFEFWQRCSRPPCDVPERLHTRQAFCNLSTSWSCVMDHHNNRSAVTASSSSRSKRPADEVDRQQPAAKREPPKHVHHSPSQAAAVATNSALHRDALLCIFEFLAQTDFSLLTRISQEWLDTATKMPCRRWSVRRTSKGHLLPIVLSPLRRHIVEVRLVQANPDYMDDLPVMSLTLLLLLGEKLPQLESLHCNLELYPGILAPRWPPKLQELNLTLVDTAMIGSEDLESATATIGRSLVKHAPGVKRAQLALLDNWNQHEPLPSTYLRALQHWPVASIGLGRSASPEALPILRRMEHLQQVHVRSQEEFIQLMSAEGPIPRLEAVDIVCGEASYSCLDVHEVTLPLLVKLPSLRRLRACIQLPDSTPLGLVFSRLHELELTDSSPECDLSLLLGALKHCAALTAFRLCDDRFTHDELAAILPSMPLLTALELTSSTVTSLHFLSPAVSPSLRATLKHLRLSRCELCVAEIRFLKHLPALERFELDQCCTAPLDAFTLATLTPGGDGSASDWWPNLRDMEYKPKGGEAQRRADDGE